MVGLFTALGRVAGRVGTEAIDRKKEEVKAKREMQLQKLNQEFLGGQNAMQIASNEKLAGAQLAATEKNTAAQLGVQERIATAGNRSSETIAKGGQETTKEVAGMQVELGREQLAARIQEVKDQIAAGASIADKDRASRETLAGDEIAAQKDIANLQVDAAQQLGITRGKDVKTGEDVWMRPDGTRVEGLKDAAGNKITLADPDASTPEMKNLAALMLLPGMTQQKAVDLIYSKGDSPSKIQLTLFDSMVKSKPFGLTGDDISNFWTLSGRYTEQILAQQAAAGAAPAAPASAAAAAAAATPAAPLTTAQRQQAIDDAKEAVNVLGISRTAVIKELAAKGISAAEAGL